MLQPLVRFFVVSALLLALPGADPTLDSPGWQEHAAAEAKAVFARAAGQIAITVPGGRAARVEAPLAIDGTDAQPLRIETRLALGGNRPLDGQAGQLSVLWPDGSVIAVAVVPGEGKKARSSTAVARWQIGPERGEKASTAELYPDGAPAFLRILISSRDVSAWASGDGSTWQRLASFPRQGAFTGAPQRLALGTGWAATGQAGGLDADDPARSAAGPTTYTFSALRVVAEPANAPAALLTGYVKGLSRLETLEQFQAGLPRDWWVAGPFPEHKATDPTTSGPESVPFDGKTEFIVDFRSREIRPRQAQQQADAGTSIVGWKAHRIGDGARDHLVQLAKVVRAGNDQARYAATVITAEKPRWELIRFDGMSKVALFINGELVAAEPQDSRADDIEADRFAVLVPLRQGRNDVLLRTIADENGQAGFTLRHEPADPRWRIALLRRLAADFPAELEEIAASHREMARMWENLGFLAEAARACSDAARITDAPAEQIEAALFERTRLDGWLRDQAAVDADIAAVQQHWAAGPASDPLTVKRRTAHLWQRIGQTANALAALREAMRLDGVSAVVREALALERLGVAASAGDVALDGELQAVAAEFPVGDPVRARLLAERADRQLAAGGKPDLATLLTSSSATILRRSAAVAGGAGDLVARAAALGRVAALPPSGAFDSPHVVHAEALAAAGDTAGAVAAYRRALAALPGAAGDAKSLDDLRRALARAILGETPAGVQILANAAKAKGDVRPVPPGIRRWWTIGPFDSPKWQAYAQPPVKPDAIDLRTPVGGKTWVQPGEEFYDENDSLDLKRYYKADNCVVFCFAEVTPEVAGPAVLNMGADDGMVVWMNGEKVHEDRIQRGVTPDSIKVKVTLQKGSNRLVCMVQNGGGGHGIQARTAQSDGWLDRNLPLGVRFVLDRPHERRENAATLAALIELALKEGRASEGMALVRLLLRALPDCWEQGLSVAGGFVQRERQALDPSAARQILYWLDATASGNLAGQRSAQPLEILRLDLADGLAGLGDFAAAVQAIQAVRWSRFEPRSQIMIRLRWAEVHQAAGYLDQTVEAYRQILDIEAIHQVDSWLAQIVRQRLGELRRLKSATPTANAPFDVLSALRTAERSLEAKSFEAGISGLQGAIATARGYVVAVAGDRFQGVAGWAADRLRRLPPEGVEAYQASQGSAALAALSAALAGDDLGLLERVACDFPIAGEAGRALEWSARRALTVGADAFAAATIANLLDGHEVAEPARGELLAAGVRAAARAGDRAVFARLAERFKATPKPQVDGAVVDPQTWLAEAGRRMTPAADPTPTAAIGTAPIAVPAEHLRDLRRFVPEGARSTHVVPAAGVGEGMAYLNGGVDGVLLDLASGAVRWRVASPPDTGPGVPDGGFVALPGMEAVIAGGRAVARARRDGRWCLEARAVASGELAWSSESVPELNGMTACSSPASDGVCALALFADTQRIAIAAFALVDGRLAWFTPLNLPRNDLDPAGRSPLGFDLAAPAVAGREAYFATDGGIVASIDTGSGALRWTRPYPRATLNGAEGRAAIAELLRRPPSRVAVAGDRILVMPRDTLGLLCIARADGALRWRRDFAGGWTLAGTAPVPGGEVVVIHGEQVLGVAAADGRELWRWQPRDGTTVGTGAVGATSVAVATAGALHRLALVDGALLGSAPWKDLGVTGSAPGNLRWAGDRLVASGNGGLAILAPAAKPVAGLPALAPGLPRSGSQPLPAAKPAAGPAPLGLAWRLPTNRILALIRPDDAQPGELLVRTVDRLFRLDVQASAVRWSTAIPSDTRAVAVNRDAILVTGSATLMLLGREEGALRWCEPIDLDPMRPLLDLEMNYSATLGESVIMTFVPGTGGAVDVRDRKTGRRRHHLTLPGSEVWAAGEVGGQLCVLAAREGQPTVAMRFDALTGRYLGEAETGAGFEDVQTHLISAGQRLLVSSPDARASVVEVASGEVRALAFNPSGWVVDTQGGLVELWQLGEDDEDGGNWRWTLWDPAKDKPLFSERYGGVQLNGSDDHLESSVLWAWRRSGDRLVRLVADRKGKMGLLCRSIAGKELWWLPSGNPGSRSYVALSVGETEAYAAFVENGRQRAEVIDLASGQVVASGGMPGWVGRLVCPAQVVGRTWLVPTEDGLSALVPGGADPGDPGARRLRGLDQLAESPATQVPRQESVDWSKLVVVPLGPEAIVAGAPGEAKIGLAHDANGVHIAIEVADGTPTFRLPGGGSLTGDGVLIGLNGNDDKLTPLVLALHEADGLPRVDLISGVYAGEPAVAGRPHLRITRAMSRQGYQLSVPWALLRADAKKRPGNQTLVNIGVTVIDRAEAALGLRSWGAGLGDSHGPRTWPVVVLLPPKPLRP